MVPILNLLLRLVLIILLIQCSVSKRLCSVCKCNDTKKILDCRNRNISEIPTLEGTKINASLLFFENNLIKHVRQFPKSPAVVELILAYNKITDIDDSAFKNLVNLIVLDLSHNLLISDKLMPQVFQGNVAIDLYEPLRKLTELNIAYNNLHSLHPNIFEHLPKLQKLTLNGNPLQLIGPGTIIAIAKIPLLKELNMANTNLEHLPEDFLHEMKYLESLDLSNNLFAEPPKSLEKSHNLQSLSLDGNRFVRIRQFPRLLFLRTLHLNRMPLLISIENRSLSVLTSLEEFYCSHNPTLVEIHENVFSYINQNLGEGEIWPPLHVLNLHNNSLRSIESHLVGRWDYLRHIDLQNNPWLCECENQWMVSNLVPLIQEIQPESLENFKCGLPSEMEDILLIDLYNRKYEMRCLDAYNHEPEKDGKLLNDIFIIVIFLAPLLMAVILYYKRYVKFNKSNTLNKKFFRYTQVDLIPIKSSESLDI